jgi:hypothetical protein
MELKILTYTFKYNNSIKLVTIKRYKEDSIKKQEPKTQKEWLRSTEKIKEVTRRKEWMDIMLI